MVDWMNYSKIQEQKRKGFKKSQVARKLGINRETVSVYWDMAPAEYAVRVESANRPRILKICNKILELRKGQMEI